LPTSKLATNNINILPRAAVFVNNNFPLRKILFLAIMLSMKLLNTTEAAEKLGVSVRRVRQLITEGKLTAHNLGRDYAIEESALAQVKTYGKPGRPSQAQTESGDTMKRDSRKRSKKSKT
jgi:excisionase family DNA binding protein